jgi:putative membrane protein
MTTEPVGPRVFEVDEPAGAARPRVGLAPQVTATERTGRIVPAEPAAVSVAAPPPRRSRVISFGLAGLGIFFAGWLVVDAYWWVAAAFERSMLLGTIAALALVAGVAGASAIIARELGSLWRLRNVESVRARLAADLIRPRDARHIISDVLAVVPKARETQVAIESFQRQVQPHHTVAQQTEILSRTVMVPLDARAEAHVRGAVLRAFGITAVSPTALSDALFFLAVGVRMVRQIAAAYGHRPTAAATVHLLRRLIVEAGRLGAVDIASTTLAQQLGGAVAERLATTAADAFYASYRMARLGVIVMDLCRPVPFRDNEVPRITALVSNVLRRRAEESREA